MKYSLLSLFVIFCSLLFISTGYAALNENLNISGEVFVTNGNSIRVMNVSTEELNNAHETYNPVFSDDSVTFYPFFTLSSSTITYRVVITNDTSRAYILQDIEELVVTNSNISFRFNNFNYGTTIGAYESISIEITLSSLRDNQSGTLSLKFIFKLAEQVPEIALELAGAKSTTDSYVKTGFFPSSESRIVVDFTFLGPRGDSVWLFSSRRAYQNQMFGIAWNYSESLLQFNTLSYNMGSGGYKANTRYVADISKEGMLLDGVYKANPPDTSWVSIFEFYMFANNEARNVRGHTNGQAIIHNVKIYESGELVLDEVPAILNTGEVAYFNTVTNTPLLTEGELIPIYE